jgi:hypothetical protein
LGSGLLCLGVHAGDSKHDEKREEDRTMSGHVRMSGFVDLRDANGNGQLPRPMNRKLSHRAPDAKGYYEQGPRNLGTGGFR